MECFSCFESFNLSDRIPLLICGEGHTTCSECSAKIVKCPLCATNCPEERKVNFALKDLVEASRNDRSRKRIAEGGFAVVYAAKWFDLPVAIKMVSLSEKGKLKLKQELNLLINLNHPSILRVFGISFFQDSIGIVMERASSAIPSPNSLTSSTLRYAKELCQAVKFLHLKSVVHGDLKPANILLVDNHVRVADFGTSKNLSATSFISRANAMTPKYAAPEQFDSDPTPFSDIYSLGIVLYEVLTGKEAFEGYQMMKIFGAKMSGKPLPFDKSTPICLQDLIMKCMNTEPLLRPKINEIIEILNNVEVLDGNCDFDQSLLIEDNQLSLKARTECFIGEILKLKQEISRLTEENTLIKKDNSKFVHQNQNNSILEDKCHQTDHHFNQTIADLQSEIVSLKKANSHSESISSGLSMEVHTLKDELSQLSNNNSALVEEMMFLKKENLRFVHENQSISKLQNKFQEKDRRLNLELSNFRTVSRSLKDENSQLKENNSTLSLKVSGLATENDSLKEKHSEIVKNLQRENERLRTHYQTESSSLKKEVFNLKKNNSDLIKNISGLSSEIQTLKVQHSQVVLENSHLKTSNSKINNENTSLKRKVEQLTKIVSASQSVPQSKELQFSNAKKHSQLQVIGYQMRVVMGGDDYVRKNILGEDPLLPGNVYTWKLWYQGTTNSLIVGVIDGSKYNVDGDCWENAHCFHNAGNCVFGCLSGNKTQWNPGKLLEINANLINYTLTIKSVGNFSINLTGNLPRLSSGNYYLYGGLWFSDHVLEIIEHIGIQR
ncbi:hypothetical protein GEMRC1_010281 [Eukaryota sp. GEM-RC1]